MDKFLKDQAGWRNFLGRVTRLTRKPTPQAEDLLQSAYLKFMRYPEKVENPAGFLLRTTRNLSIDEDRKRGAQRLASSEVDFLDTLPSDMPGPDEVYAARKRLQEVASALMTLPSRTRRIFLMHRLDGVNYRDIARREGISVSAVEKHIAKSVLFIADLRNKL